MNKPASVAIRELENNIENCINSSGLPPIIVEMVLRGYYIQIKEMAKNQTENENASYKKSLRESLEDKAISKETKEKTKN